MWDTIARVLTDKQASTVLAFIILGFVVLSTLAKLGIVNIRTEHVRIGQATSNEREIVKRQIAFIEGAINMFESKIPKYTGYNNWRAKTVLSLVYKECISWVLFNHIKDTPEYIGLKQTIIWNIILCNCPNELHRSDEFKRLVCDHIAESIKILIKIRKEYQ